MKRVVPTGGRGGTLHRAKTRLGLLHTSFRPAASPRQCKKLQTVGQCRSVDERVEIVPVEQRENDCDFNKKSFSREWEFFDYEGDNTWGWTLEQRKRIFLDDMELKETELRGKLLLDAGCGNGALTATLAALGLEVVGVDLNNGLAAIESRKARFAGRDADHVHFVQGNLAKPPFKRSLFDLIYCSGVIHHTPNSQGTFNALVPLVKSGGRLYVWVYGKRSFTVRAFFNCGRQLKKIMSLKSLMTLCRLLAPVYNVGTRVLNSVGFMPFRKRTNREIALDLFDAFAPKYNHTHAEDEVQGWFSEKGFTNITVSGRQKHGFGVYGDKQ